MISEVILSNCIVSNSSSMSKLHDKLNWSPHSQLHSVDPLGVIKRFFISQVIRRVLASAYHNLNSAIVISTGSSTAIIHSDHLLMKVGIFNNDTRSNGVEVR